MSAVAGGGTRAATLPIPRCPVPMPTPGLEHPGQNCPKWRGDVLAARWERVAEAPWAFHAAHVALPAPKPVGSSQTAPAVTRRGYGATLLVRAPGAVSAAGR